MANSYIDALKQVQLLLQEQYGDWDEIDKKILKIADSAQKITMSDVDGSIKELNNRIQQNVDLRKQMNQVITEQETKIKALQSQIAKLSATQNTSSEKQKRNLTDEERQLKTLENSQKRLTDTKSKHWKQVEANRTAANAEAKAARAVGSAYAQASLELTQITKEYQDLAIRKARNNDLTAEEILKMDALEAQINQLRPQLVAIDQRVGQFGRSVGSYGKQFDSLGFSMAQITREMPAFAYGAQIGFAALSNNIPMLVDEINKVKESTAALKAEGKATTSVLSQIGSALFSWQTLLSVAVTLLTIYGDELIDAAGDLFDFRSETEKAEAKLEKLNKALETFLETLTDVNQARLEGSKNAQEELTMLQLLDDVVKDVNRSQVDRKKALSELKSQYPGYLKNMSDEEIYAKGIGEAYTIIAQSILEAARAKAAFDKMVSNYETIQEISTQIGVLNSQLDEYAKVVSTDAFREFESQQRSIRNSMGRTSESTSLAIKRMEMLERQYPREAAAAKGLVEVRKELNDLLDYRATIQANNQSLAENIGNLDDLIESTDGVTDATKRAKTEMLEINLAQQYTVAYYEKVISALQEEQKLVSRSSAEWENYQKAIEEAQKAIAIITDIQQFARDEMSLTTDELKAQSDEIVEYLTTQGIGKGMKDLSEITGESLADLTRQFHDYYSNDFDSFMEFFEAKMNKREEEKDKIKELQGEILDASIGLANAMFEGEIEKIELRIEANKDYYANLLNNAELTEERRSALEAERDAKERKLLKEKRKRETQQFLFEKAVALAETTIYVAKAITEYGILSPVAILAGILGAIQIATIAAQTIPKFATGTENAPVGMAIVDELRPEVHTDKHGNVKSFGSEKGSNLRFLEQGDKIYRSREEYFKNLGTNEIENVIWGLNMQHQGRPIPERDVNTALLREVSALRGENTKVWREVKKLAGRPIHNSVKVEMPDNRPY